MLLNHLRLLILLAATFSAVLCVPQALSAASKYDSNDEGLSTNAESLASLTTPSNIALISGTSFQQDNSYSVALQGDGLETTPSIDSPLTGTELLGGDPGKATLNSLFDATDDEGFDAVDAKVPTANSALFAQAQQPPENPSDTPSKNSGESPGGDIENTPSEEAAGARAEDGRRRNEKSPGLFNNGANRRQGYDDSKCPQGAKWACCVPKKGGTRWLCRWLNDNSLCLVYACCYPNPATGRPDEYCPDMPPQRKAPQAFEGLLDVIKPLIFGPAGGVGGGAIGGAGAAGIGGGSSNFRS